MIETWDDFISMERTEQIRFYFQLHHNDYTDKRIAEMLGAPEYTIWNWKKSNGIKTDRKYSAPFKKASYTICWDCKNALGRCSWSQSFVPVEGWTAIVTPPAVYLSEAMQKIPDYCVIKCPEFEKG